LTAKKRDLLYDEEKKKKQANKNTFVQYLIESKQEL